MATMAQDVVHPPTAVDSFVPQKENFDGNIDSAGQERQSWELERDLAPLKDWQLSQMEANEAALEHRGNSLRKRKDTKSDSLFSVVCAYVLEHQVGMLSRPWRALSFDFSSENFGGPLCLRL
jgi:hypothetical protein